MAGNVFQGGKGLFTAWNPAAALGAKPPPTWVAVLPEKMTPELAQAFKNAGIALVIWEPSASQAGVNAVNQYGAVGYIAQAEGQGQLDAANAIANQITVPKALVTNNFMTQYPPGWIAMPEAYTQNNPQATADQVTKDAQARGATVVIPVVGLGFNDVGGGLMSAQQYAASLAAAGQAGATGSAAYIAEQMSPEDLNTYTSGAVPSGAGGGGSTGGQATPSQPAPQTGTPTPPTTVPPTTPFPSAAPQNAFMENVAKAAALMKQNGGVLPTSLDAPSTTTFSNPFGQTNPPDYSNLFNGNNNQPPENPFGMSTPDQAPQPTPEVPSPFQTPAPTTNPFGVPDVPDPNSPFGQPPPTPPLVNPFDAPQQHEQSTLPIPPSHMPPTGLYPVPQFAPTGFYHLPQFLPSRRYF